MGIIFRSRGRACWFLSVEMEFSKTEGIDPTVPTVTGLVLLDNEGKRIAVDYFSKELCV